MICRTLFFLFSENVAGFHCTVNFFAIINPRCNCTQFLPRDFNRWINWFFHCWKSAELFLHMFVNDGTEAFLLFFFSNSNYYFIHPSLFCLFNYPMLSWLVECVCCGKKTGIIQQNRMMMMMTTTTPCRFQKHR